MSGTFKTINPFSGEVLAEYRRESFDAVQAKLVGARRAFAEWSRIPPAERFAAAANVGTVFMNRCDYLDPALPWTGVKDSGMGSALSPFGFYALTRRKSIHFRESF